MVMIQMTEIQFYLSIFLIATWFFIFGFVIGKGHGENNNK